MPKGKKKKPAIRVSGPSIPKIPITDQPEMKKGRCKKEKGTIVVKGMALCLFLYPRNQLSIL